MTGVEVAATAVVSLAALAAGVWAVGAHVPVRNRVSRWRHGGRIRG